MFVSVKNTGRGQKPYEQRVWRIRTSLPVLWVNKLLMWVNKQLKFLNLTDIIKIIICLGHFKVFRVNTEWHGLKDFLVKKTHAVAAFRAPSSVAFPLSQRHSFICEVIHRHNKWKNAIIKGLSLCFSPMWQAPLVVSGRAFSNDYLHVNFLFYPKSRGLITQRTFWTTMNLGGLLNFH